MALTCRVCTSDCTEADFQPSQLARGNLRCRACAAKYYRDNRDRNPDKLLDQNLRRKYGISADDFYEMEEAQGGKCAICTEIPEGRLYVDHCHETHEIRGLLCRTCNIVLGQFNDDHTRFSAAAAYLNRTSTIG